MVCDVMVVEGRTDFTGYQKEKEIEEIMIIATAGGKKEGKISR